MTRKDYQLIAGAFRRARDYNDSAAKSAGHQVGTADAAIMLASALQEDNPRFDRERFLKACGVHS